MQSFISVHCFVLKIQIITNGFANVLEISVMVDYSFEGERK